MHRVGLLKRVTDAEARKSGTKTPTSTAVMGTHALSTHGVANLTKDVMAFDHVVRSVRMLASSVGRVIN